LDEKTQQNHRTGRRPNRLVFACGITIGEVAGGLAEAHAVFGLTLEFRYGYFSKTVLSEITFPMPEEITRISLTGSTV
jgi:hypothetical protein